MQLKELETAVRQCQQCRLYQNRTHVVPGEGNPAAELMFIGEGPGKNEDEQGRPFVGAAGKLLTALIRSINLKREDVYIANVVKCRPPNNRDPLPDEAEACWPWLEKQIAIIKPLVIVLLGRHSLARFISSARISQDHGRALRKPFGKKKQKIIFFPCYHPAAALYNGRLKETLAKDFKKIPKILEIACEKTDNQTKNDSANPGNSSFLSQRPSSPIQGKLFEQ